MKKTFLLKLSGEALKNKQDGIYDINVLNKLAKQVKEIVDAGNNIGIVIGGGNILRGKDFEVLGFERCASDNLGMIATCMNALAFKQALHNNNQKAVVMSAIKVSGCDEVNLEKVNELFSKQNVILFAGGLGNPYFSTDSACALRAIEINADYLLIAKNGVDGVYDSDPKLNAQAKKYAEISYDDILKQELKVIDLSAALLMKEHKLKAVVFDMDGDDNIIKAINMPNIGTILK